MKRTVEMTPEAIRDADQRYIGHLLETIRKLERQLGEQQILQAQSQTYNSMCKHRHELGEWLVDQATTNGRLNKPPTVDAALGGEDFVPGSFALIVSGTKYAFELVSTVYSVEEVD